jgi:hypothetical protein
MNTPGSTVWNASHFGSNPVPDSELELPWSIMRHHLNRGQLIVEWKNLIGIYWHSGVLRETEKGLTQEELRERWDADKACAFEESQPGQYTVFEFADKNHPDRLTLRRMSNHFLPWKPQP